MKEKGQKGKNPEGEKKGWKGGKENGREARRVRNFEGKAKKTCPLLVEDRGSLKL